MRFGPQILRFPVHQWLVKMESPAIYFNIYLTRLDWFSKFFNNFDSWHNEILIELRKWDESILSGTYTKYICQWYYYVIWKVIIDNIGKMEFKKLLEMSLSRNWNTCNIRTIIFKIMCNNDKHLPHTFYFNTKYTRAFGRLPC